MRYRKRAIPDWFDQAAPYYHRQDAYYPPPDPSQPLPPPSWFYLNQGKQPLGSAQRGQQVTADEVHPEWSRPGRRARGFSGDVGGEFLSERYSVSVSDGKQRTGSGKKDVYGTQYRDKYIGPFFATDPSNLVIPPLPPGEDLNAMGTTAIARCKPTNAVADVGVALGEIFTAGLPKLFGASLWKDKVSKAKGSAGEYLNAEFGWKPLVSDIKDVAYAAANSDRILSQYEKNAGSVVRRRYEFPIEETFVDEFVAGSDGWAYSPVALTSLLDETKTKPNLRRSIKTLRRVWFSGAFTYYLPRGYNSRNGMVSAAAKAGPLLGLSLTPETVWNLTPWSWAIDWFSNAGDVVSNLSDWATDGLVMKYGYIMEHTVSTTTYYLDGPSRLSLSGGLPATVIITRESKRRQAASPFGFGVTWDGLSPRQLAITVALGITRVFR